MRSIVMPNSFLHNLKRLIVAQLKMIKYGRKIKALDKIIEKSDHEQDVLNGLNAMGERGPQAIVYFSRYHKKPRGVKHNLVHLWPKKVLDQVLTNNGIPVTTPPNYEVAFNMLLDKVYAEDKHETNYVES